MAGQFTSEEYRRIDAATTEVERNTTANLDLVVTRVSDRYSMYPLVGAAFGALAIAGIAALTRPGMSGRSAILIELILLIAFTLLLDWLPMRLTIVPARVKRAHARQLAHREFSAQAAGNGDRKRILLFVSLGERYVEILTDQATHALVSSETWEKMVADFLTEVKAGRVADGIVGAIEACGTVLATHHPRPNENP